MIDQIYVRFFRHLINVDGRLPNDYALKVYNSELNHTFFLSFDAKENKFYDTPFSYLWNIVKEYFDTYRNPPSDITLAAEIVSSTRLNSQKKQDIDGLLTSIRRCDEEAGQFDFLRDRIREQYIKDRQIFICTQGVKLAQEDPMAGTTFVQNELANLMARTTISDSVDERSMHLWQLMETQLAEFRENGTLMAGAIPYGFDAWDMALGGMYPGELVIVAGRPGTGKSFIVSQIGYAAALDSGLKVVIANREMLYNQVVNRFIARQTKIPSRKLRRAEALSDEEKALVEASMEEFITSQNKNLFFIPPAKCHNVAMITREIELAFGQDTPDLIIVDYLNDLEADHGHMEGHERIGRVTQALKGLAVHFKCPVMSPTQPSSAGLTTENPSMADLGYKVIAQKADTILFCTEDPEHKYVAPMLETQAGQPGIINVKVIKARNDSIPPTPFRLSAEFATTSICVAGRLEQMDAITLSLQDD